MVVLLDFFLNYRSWRLVSLVGFFFFLMNTHWLVSWVGRNQKNKIKKWHRPFNQLKPTCNSLGWNLETARHGKLSLHKYKWPSIILRPTLWTIARTCRAFYFFFLVVAGRCFQLISANVMWVNSALVIYRVLNFIVNTIFTLAFKKINKG